MKRNPKTLTFKERAARKARRLAGARCSACGYDSDERALRPVYQRGETIRTTREALHGHVAVVRGACTKYETLYCANCIAIASSMPIGQHARPATQMPGDGVGDHPLSTHGPEVSSQ